MKLLILLVFLSLEVFAQTTPMASPSQTLSPSREFPKSKWPEVYSIIDGIKVQNPPQNLKIRAKSGLVQIASNTPAQIDDSGFPSVGLEVGIDVIGNFGIEAKYLYAQNLMTPSERNGTDTYITWLDIGPTYTIFFDSTRLDDYLAIKLYYHSNDANIVRSDSENPATFFINHYAGFSPSIERSIPITPKLGVIASFDLLQITDVSDPYLARSSGYGFQIQGELYYRMSFLSKPMRLGLSYWQQGNDTEFNGEAKQTTGHNSYFQLARALFINASFAY